MKEIRARMPENIDVTTSAEIGIPPEYKEAVKFATIAYSTINCVPGNIPAAGHASQYAILGKIALAPRHIAGGAQFIKSKKRLVNSERGEGLSARSTIMVCCLTCAASSKNSPEYVFLTA